jgi:preprotein translocase subunit YajC
MAAVATTAAGSDFTLTLLYMALIVGVFYFLWFRPQQTARKKAREMLATLAPGDRIMTAGGIIGVVRSFDGDIIDLEIASGVVIRVTQRAVIERIPDVLEPGDE